MQGVFPGLILALLIVLPAAFLVNLPSLYLEEGLPVFPALLAGRAVKGSGNVQDDDTRVVAEKLTVSRLVRLEDVGPAFDFDPIPGRD